MPTIRIDEDVWNWLKSHATPFEDTPNSVLRRFAGLDSKPENSGHEQTRDLGAISAQAKISQGAFRQPIIDILKKHGGQASRTDVLIELEQRLGSQMTAFDKGTIKSGTIRWQKSAEWEVSVMRQQGLLKPRNASARGVWCLSTKRSLNGGN
jgi:hypothetical protein